MNWGTNFILKIYEYLCILIALYLKFYIKKLFIISGFSFFYRTSPNIVFFKTTFYNFIMHLQIFDFILYENKE